jgi:thiol-disulfide isomerase/thioredoxin
MKIKKLLFFAFLAILLFSGCESKDKIDGSVVANQAVKKEIAPIFNLTTSTGKQVKLIANKKGWEFKGFENKVILLDFFGTWCPPCKAEIPHLNSIRSKTKARFEILGIDVGPRGGGVTSKIDMQNFIKDYKIKYPIMIGRNNGKLFGAVSELNKRGSIPFMILFNKKGEYVTHYIGMVPEEMLQSDIDKILSN